MKFIGLLGQDNHNILILLRQNCTSLLLVDPKYENKNFKYYEVLSFIRDISLRTIFITSAYFKQNYY